MKSLSLVAKRCVLLGLIARFDRHLTRTSAVGTKRTSPLWRVRPACGARAEREFGHKRSRWRTDKVFLLLISCLQLSGFSRFAYVSH